MNTLFPLGVAALPILTGSSSTVRAQGPLAEVLTMTLLSRVFDVAATLVQVPGVSPPILDPLQTERRPEL